MGRRAAAKVKVQLPTDDEDSRSESDAESSRAYVSDSSSFQGSSASSGGESEAEAKRPSKKRRLKSRSESGDAGSSDESEDERPRKRKRSLVEDSDSSASFSEDSSVSISSEESELSADEQPRRKKSSKTAKTKAKRKQKRKNADSTKESVIPEPKARKRRAGPTAMDEETSSEEEPRSGTDSEEDWEPDEEAVRGEEMKWKIETVEESDRESEWEEEEWGIEKEPGKDEDEELFADSDFNQAKYVLRNITARVPYIEQTALRRGEKITGPPLEFAPSHLDENARKFRWPQHVRNLRNSNFCQDASEILADYEVSLEPQGQAMKKESAFAQVPRPIVALAAKALRRSSRKRKRATDREYLDKPSAIGLINIARIGGRFGDHFVESLLSANGKALQGIDSGFDYDKRCWSSLPIKKKPIANWRFVLEHLRRTVDSPASSNHPVLPPMKPETLARISNRLKKLYGHTTQNEEYDVFAGSASTAGSNWYAPQTKASTSGDDHVEPSTQGERNGVEAERTPTEENGRVAKQSSRADGSLTEGEASMEE